MTITPHSLFGVPNPVLNSDGDFWYRAKEVLKAAGWTHFASGDGTSFSTTPGNVNDQIASAAEMAVNNAWYVLADPGNRRQIMVHKGVATGSFRVYYSALDTFIGTGFGAISATVPPSATDQQQLMGTGGGFTTLTYTDRVSHFVAESDVFAGNVYPFWFTTRNVSTSGAPVTSLLFSCEAMDAGSFPVADADPCVWHCGTITDPLSTTTSGWFGWFKMNLGGETWVRHTMLGYREGASISYSPEAWLAPENQLGHWPLPSPAWVSSGASNAWKGFSRHIRWDPGYDNNGDRYTLDFDGNTNVVASQFFVPSLPGRRG